MLLDGRQMEHQSHWDSSSEHHERMCKTKIHAERLKATHQRLFFIVAVASGEMNTPRIKDTEDPLWRCMCARSHLGGADGDKDEKLSNQTAERQ